MQPNKHNWSQLIDEQKNGNLTITEFCRQKKLNKSSFYRWIHKLSSPVCEDDSSEQAKMEYWRSLIEEQRTSNMGTVKFCREKQLSQTTFYRWKNKLDAEHISEHIMKKEKVEWVTAVSMETPAFESEDICVSVGAFTVIVPQKFDESVFAGVCKVLVALC